MKDDISFHRDDSCSFWEYFRGRKCYRYPVVYTDGLISRLKSCSEGRQAWGFLVQGYVVSIRPSPRGMFPGQLQKFCRSVSFAGRVGRLMPFSVLSVIVHNIVSINDLLAAVGGVPFEKKWYLSEKDAFEGSPEGLVIKKPFDVKKHFVSPPPIVFPFSETLCFVEEDTEIDVLAYPVVEL